MNVFEKFESKYEKEKYLLELELKKGKMKHHFIYNLGFSCTFENKNESTNLQCYSLKTIVEWIEHMSDREDYKILYITLCGYSNTKYPFLNFNDMGKNYRGGGGFHLPRFFIKYFINEKALENILMKKNNF